MVWAVHIIITISTEDSSTRARDERVHVTSALGVPQLQWGADVIPTFSCAGSSTAPFGADVILAASVRGQGMPGEGVRGQTQHFHGASLTLRVRELAYNFVSILLTRGHSMGCDHILRWPQRF